MSATVSHLYDTPSGSHLVSVMTLNDNKAGMEGIDKEKINQIIYEASKGSKFFENEQKKEEKLNQRIKEQQNLISSLSPGQLLQGLKEADELIQNLKDNRDLTHTFVHVDMDAFYAAVEMRDDARLRDKPMAVGGMGMLSTSNYIARRYGVRAAMPGFIGLKLCPNLVLVKPNFKKYMAVSLEIREIFAQYDPNFQPMSLDEAYLDITEHLKHRSLSSNISRLFLIRPKSEKGWILLNDSECSCDLNNVLRSSVINSEKLNLISASLENMQAYLNSLDINGLDLPRVCAACNKRYSTFSLKLYGVSTEDAVMEMRNRIEQRTFLTASAGIAPNTMLAKVCSDINKPNGQFRILPNLKEIEEFMKNLPIRKISGIGKVTEKLLGSLSINLCFDLYTQRAILYHAFSLVSFQYFMKIMLGIGSTSLGRDEERKSISTEQTFSEINEPSQLYEKCSELCQLLVEDLNKEQLMGKTVSLKIKTVSFEVKTRSHTLQNYTSDERIIFNAAKHLLKTEIDAVKPNVLRLRLMGVRISKFMTHGRNQASIVKMLNDTTKDSSNTIFKTSKVISFPNIDHGKTDTTVDYIDEDSKLLKDSCDFQFQKELLEVQKNFTSSKKHNEKSSPKKTSKKNRLPTFHTNIYTEHLLIVISPNQKPLAVPSVDSKNWTGHLISSINIWIFASVEKQLKASCKMSTTLSYLKTKKEFFILGMIQQLINMIFYFQLINEHSCYQKFVLQFDLMSNFIDIAQYSTLY
ncbi:hypothetical protein Btru_027523 [Bulinus truncatus]|nr:hypothetical protein Btru_027523 [Bulinus truncatus]